MLVPNLLVNWQHNPVEDRLVTFLGRLEYIERLANKRLNILSAEITAMAAQKRQKVWEEIDASS